MSKCNSRLDVSAQPFAQLLGNKYFAQSFLYLIHLKPLTVDINNRSQLLGTQSIVDQCVIKG